MPEDTPEYVHLDLFLASTRDGEMRQDYLQNCITNIRNNLRDLSDRLRLLEKNSE